ncbi:MAG TPA: hypothetical protein EYG16_08205 [Deltaproteobacteria bacterium]|nr:hypothetical protein [Candidatus Binatota bacterium]HIL13639.1 hypothetical protein [Deltaproteobacteria bacterium]
MTVVSNNRRGLVLAPLLAALMITAVAATAPAEESGLKLPGGLLVFPDLTVTKLNGASGDEDTFTANPGVDLFFSRDYGKLRLLAELFFDKYEQELERLMVGKQLTPGTSVWGGRFLAPLGYWNTAFHHGTWLQTSISRPGIIEFEDKGGALPMHITGVLAQGDLPVHGASLSWEAGAGLGPKLEAGELEPYDLLDPSDGDRDLAAAVTVTLRRSKRDLSGVGLFAGYWDAERDDSVGGDLRLTVYGGNLMLELDALLLSGALFYVEDKSRDGQFIINSHFTSGYLQAEYSPGSDWTTYARAELASNASESPYLANFPDFVTEGYLAGLRWDFSDRQAFKLEVGDLRRLGTHSRRFMLQWSAQLP